VKNILNGVSEDYDLALTCGAESFLTRPGEWTELVRGAVADITGRQAEYTTHGGTSDARFIKEYCPVVEFGLINKTVHQVNENTRVSDIVTLTGIYERVLERYFAKSSNV
jgi:succinyl-diaminopimelate desuccinylase